MATNNPPSRKAVKHPGAWQIAEPEPHVPDAVSSNKPKLVYESPFDSVKVFSATKHLERANLGELITSWIRNNPGIEIVDKIVSQSSDSEFHCLSITLFYRSAP